MSELVNNNITVIKQNDPDIPDYLDFEKLRKEGLEHIGNLSGKIWTDHNAHDPGVTILEVLVYALMDLGYRTNLPFEDLITVQNDSKKDDNFLTPLEILTINPVTITDYRKLVLEINGVRNAWLEPVHQQRDLYLDRYSNTLFCKGSVESDIKKNTSAASNENDCQEIKLNGLYNVYIEKDSNIINNNLENDVKALLSQHRNLCEDFVEIKTLIPLDVGLCVQVEIHAEFEAEKVYVEIFNKVKNYIQPEIKYYTLQELLDKGKTIDDIFAGRPYSEESFGFIDTEELENFDRREYINLSDVYHAILSIEGVRKIKKIEIEGNLISDPQSPDWRKKIRNDHVPVFSLDKTCIDLFSVQGFLNIDKTRIHRSFALTKQFTMPIENLDTEIPQGACREDLEEYYSIQNDFPVVYGIGDDGLPESSTLLRKTQALQLKGYLMFYDQILANYTSQLAHIRSLFSLKPEDQKTEEEKRTYFTQIPDSIPGIEKLLRFYNNDGSVSKGTLLATPVANDAKWQQIYDRLKIDSSIELTIGNSCSDKNTLLDLFSFSSTGVRAIYINQLVDSFFNKNYDIEILFDRRGYFFVIQASLPDDIIIVGTRRYKTMSEALKEAKNIIFIGTMNQSYSLITNASDTLLPDQHYFDITYNPISYIEIIQELTEDKDEYTIRRKQFLDHLLARFGEEFTDFTILHYQNKINTSDFSKTEVDSQSKYINEFAEVSHNRGKAFDYSIPSWNTENVSGFEKRISLLAGIGNYKRRNLCNFEVVQNFRILLKDWAGNVLFRSNRGYESKKELYNDAKKVLAQIRDPESYRRLEKSLNSFNAKTIHRIFSEKPENENIMITKYDYHQELRSAHDEVVVRSKNMKMKSEKEATDKKDDFIKEINNQNRIANNDKINEYRLLPLHKENTYLDANALNCEIETLITWKWHVKDSTVKKEVSSQQIFEDYEEAWEDMVRKAKLDSYLTRHDVGINWKLNINKNISIKGLDCYPDAYKAVTAWRQSKVLGSVGTNYLIENEDEYVRIKLKNEKGNVIAISNDLDLAHCNLETVIEDCTAVFGNRSTKPDYDNEKEKFGFQVLDKNNIPALVSYCVYDSEKEALQQIETVFKFGENKKNYLLSGDQGNPEYNFILLDQYNSFLALPTDHFETAKDRTKVLNARIKYFKDHKLPVFVKEEPRRYVWCLLKDEKKVLKGQAEFTSKAKAQSDFDKVVAVEAVKSNNELFAPYCYNFDVIAIPALYKYRYGVSNAQNELEPLFLSTNTFKTYDDASLGYTDFVKKLPSLSFKVSPKNNANYELYVSGSKTPIVGGYQNQKPSLEKAKALVSYISKIYTKTLAPKEGFVTQGMIENQNGRYEWRFYKKNAPLAINPGRFSNELEAERIKALICDVIPPVDLRQCPKKSVIVCPDGNPNQYHYQVQFSDIYNHEFILISYIGYTSREKAEEAWQKEWFKIIQLATNPEEYKDSGKINIEETYKNPESKACDNESFLAVIPKKIRDNVEVNGRNIIEYYTGLSDIYPICEVIEDDTIDKVTYKYKVVAPQNPVIIGDGPAKVESNVPRNILWLSENCYDNIQGAIAAYQYFYNLAGTSNNCRTFCEKGSFYVGLVEVLAESSQEFNTEREAWDDVYPEREDSCGNCIPGGVREFVYAAADDKNYIATCDQECWKFKVVSSDYFVADHNCYYNSKILRDEQIEVWISKLENLNWDQYIFWQSDDGSKPRRGTEFLADIGYGYSIEEFCELVFAFREGLNKCKEIADIKSFLIEKYKDDNGMIKLINSQKFDINNIQDLVDYFPVYKTDNGYCYRLYSAENDVKITPEGLQPCGCEPDTVGEDNLCDEPYPFVSSNCYSCCTEALCAFIKFCTLINDPDRSYAVECTSKTAYGPYSFQIIDKNKELAYHPQQYESFQEVTNAIKITKECANDVGMHLLEHILLRPTPESKCTDRRPNEGGEGYESVSCLLPVCPDYECCLEWQIDLDNDDPCAKQDIPPKINYIPGSDPYSFWATLVMPAWGERFRTKEKREAFEKFLYKETPALVGLNILWLSPRDLCKFEDAYHKWLLWKENDTSNYSTDTTVDVCNANDIAPYCLVSECIRDLESESACSSAPDEGGDCNCNKDQRITLPEDSMGSIFWGVCSQGDGDTAGGPRIISRETTTAESNVIIETTTPESKAAVKKTTVKSTKKTAVKKGKPTPKKVISETKTNEKKIVKKTETSKQKSKVKTVKKEPIQKAKKAEVTSTQKAKKDNLAGIRQRKPKYLSNVENIADEDIKKTKSYERVIFFLQNTPTIAEYNKLVDFFARYSLQKDNKSDFMGLLKNATWHLFDKLVLDSALALKKEQLDELTKKMMVLKSKGLSLKELDKEWNSNALGSLVNKKPLAQLKKIVK